MTRFEFQSFFVKVREVRRSVLELRFEKFEVQFRLMILRKNKNSVCRMDWCSEFDVWEAQGSKQG